MALTPDELQLAFHEVECHTYDERFGIAAGPRSARATAREVARLCGHDPRWGAVADVGCGTGYLGLGLAAAGRVREPILVDLSPGMLARARDNAAAFGVEAALVQATAAQLPLPSGHLDAVVTRGVLHHLHDPVAALVEWRRVVRPGGAVVIVSEPAPMADRAGAWVARATLGALRGARNLAHRLGRPLSEHDPATADQRHYWDLVAMAANLHTFTVDDLRRDATAAGYDDVEVSATATISIAWAGLWYVLVGELPELAASARAKQRAGRVFAALRGVEAAVADPLVPTRLRLTTRALLRVP